MKATELALPFLKEQGFLPQVDEDGNIIFKYQMLNFTLVNYDDDDMFFQLVMPGIAQASEDNREVVLEAINKVNWEYKAAKIVLADNVIHILIETMLDNDPELSLIMPRSLNILIGARQALFEQFE